MNSANQITTNELYDIGILTYYPTMLEAFNNFINNSTIRLVTDESRGGILLSVNYSHAETSPFFQYVFDKDAKSKEQHNVTEVFLKISIVSNKLKSNSVFEYVRPDTHQTKTVTLYNTNQENAVKEYHLHFDIFQNNRNKNVEKWINVPSPICMLICEGANRLTQLNRLLEKGDDVVKKLLQTMMKTYNITDLNEEYGVSLFCMEKIDAISFADIQVNNNDWEIIKPNIYYPVNKQESTIIRHDQPIQVSLHQTINLPQSVKQVKNESILKDKAMHEFNGKKLMELAVDFFKFKDNPEPSAAQQTNIIYNQQIQMLYTQLFIYELFKLFDYGNGFLHGDIHYRNVLYDNNNDNPIVYLIDFGNSKACSDFEKIFDEIKKKNKELLENTEIQSLYETYKDDADFSALEENCEEYYIILDEIFENDVQKFNEYMDVTTHLRSNGYDVFKLYSLLLQLNVDDLDDFIEGDENQIIEDDDPRIGIDKNHIVTLFKSENELSQYIFYFKKIRNDYDIDKAIMWQNYGNEYHETDKSKILTLFHYGKILKKHVYVYYDKLLPQINEYQKQHGASDIKINLIKSLLLNYVSIETVRNQGTMYDTEYDFPGYQWYFYFYIKPLLTINNMDIRINFENKDTADLLDFIVARLNTDVKGSLEFYFDNVKNMSLEYPHYNMPPTKTTQMEEFDELPFGLSYLTKTRTSKRARTQNKKRTRFSLGGHNKRHMQGKKSKKQRKFTMHRDKKYK